jgi:uncharacterized membrane protein
VERQRLRELITQPLSCSTAICSAGQQLLLQVDEYKLNLHSQLLFIQCKECPNSAATGICEQFCIVIFGIQALVLQWTRLAAVTRAGAQSALAFQTFVLASLRLLPNSWDS